MTQSTETQYGPPSRLFYQSRPYHLATTSRRDLHIEAARRHVWLRERCDECGEPIRVRMREAMMVAEWGHRILCGDCADGKQKAERRNQKH